MILVFDEFELDPDRLELRREGMPVKAEPAVLRLLACLVRNAGRLVTKQDLVDQVWDGRSVAENAITVAMVRLRKVLGHKPGERELIVNLHGRGYRFTRPVAARESALAPLFGRNERPTEGPPFVGREPVMQRLRAALREASAGRGSLCVLSGEPGIGKTRALEMLEREAGASDASVHWGYCREVGDTPPLWPFAQLARDVLAKHAGRELVTRLGAAAPDLERLVPVLETGSANTPDAAADAAEHLPAKHRVFDAVTRLFALAAEHQPLVLVLDDLHRADAASLELLRYWVDELAHLPVLVLCTLRSTEWPRDELADAHVGYVLGHRNCTRIGLPRLDEGAVSAYVAALFEEAAPALGRSVFARSEGNPFFMTELARQLRDSGETDPDALALPRAALDIVRQRVALLSREACSVLSCAAVIGRSFELGVLQAVTARELTLVMEVIDAAVESEVVVAAPDSKTGFAFGHELLRQVLYEQLSPSEQRECHLRVAHSLAQRLDAGEGIAPGDLAFHAHAALPHGDMRVNVRYCMDAAIAAGRIFANADAVRYLRYALEALDLSETPNNRLRPRLVLWQAVHARVYSHSEFQRLVQEAITLARAQRDGLILARAAMMLDPHPGFPPLPGSRAALEETLDLLAPADHGTRAAVLARLSITAPLIYDGKRSRAQLATALADTAHGPAVLGRYSARMAQLYLAGGPGQDQECAQAARALEELFREHPQAFPVPPAFLALQAAITALQAGEPAAMTAALERCESRCRALDIRELLWHAERFRAVAQINLGRIQDGTHALLALHKRAERDGLIGTAVFSAYDCCVVLHDGPMTRERLRAALAIEPEDLPNIWSMKVRALAASGLHAEARTALAHVAPDRLVMLPNDRDHLGTLGALVRPVLELAASEYYEPLSTLLQPHAQRFAAHASFYCEGSISHLLGLLAGARGQHDAAVAQLETAISACDRAALIPSAIRARLDLCARLARSDSLIDRAQAQKLERVARELARQIGLTALPAVFA